MTFVLLEPNTSKAETGINVAWRHASNREYNLLVVSFTADLLRQLGWQECTRLTVHYCDETARVMVRPAAHRTDGFALTRRNAKGKPRDRSPAHMITGLPGIHGEKRPAKPAPWTQDAGAVVIQLPDWAKHPRHTQTEEPRRLPGRIGRSIAA
jgi:hypothetical protein